MDSHHDNPYIAKQATPVQPMKKKSSKSLLGLLSRKSSAGSAGEVEIPAFIKLDMAHDFEQKSHVFDNEEVFDEIQRLKTSMIGFVVLANQVKQDVLPKHEKKREVFSDLIKKHLWLILYKQKMIAPWVEYVEQCLIKREGVNFSQILGASVNESKRKTLLQKLAEADKYSLITEGVPRHVQDFEQAADVEDEYLTFSLPFDDPEQQQQQEQTSLSTSVPQPQEDPSPVRRSPSTSPKASPRKSPRSGKAEKVSYSADERAYIRMMERIETLWVEPFYQTPEQIEAFESGKVEPNYSAICMLLKAVDRVYRRAIEHVQKTINGDQKNSKSNLKQFYSSGAKLYMLDFGFWGAMMASKDHLFYKPQDDPEWKRVYEHFSYMQVGDDQKVAKSYRFFANNFAVSIAGMSKTSHLNGLTKHVASVAGLGYYKLMESQRLEQMNMFKSNPDIKTAASCWNLIEQPQAKLVISPLLPSIELQQLLHVPKMEESITLANVENLPAYNDWERDIGNHDNIYGPSSRFMQFDEGKYDPVKFTQVRVLCASNFSVNPDKYWKKGQFLEHLQDKVKPCGIETVIIHIHGGGFISTTSYSHQSYTRIFAKQIPNSVVFSIDYRLAPKSRFPDQIDDCWQAYTWIILNIKRLFGIDFKRVIMTGDSAGGNLCLAVTTMAIMRNFRRPDGILPVYPSTICTPSTFWPSLLNSLDDPILSQSFLILISQAYPPAGEKRNLGLKNPYLSPGLCTTDEVLSQFPKTRLIFAGICPLKDEGLLLFSRLLKNNVEAKAIEIRLMPHGFLSYHLPFGQGMSESLPCINKTVEFMKELLQ